MIKRLTNDIVDERLKVNTQGTIRISSYINGSSKITFQCKLGHQWEAIPGSVMSAKSGCPVCHIIKGLKKSKYYLYYFKAVDETIEYKEVYKIGITYMNNKDEDIIHALSRRYQYEYSKIIEESIQYVVYDTAAEAAYIEYEIIKINQINSITRKYYIEHIFLHGRSEMFNFDILRGASLKEYTRKHMNLELLNERAQSIKTDNTKSKSKKRKRRYTVEEKSIFLRDANDKFKDKFDYTKSKYLGKSTKTTIICPIHGEFKQSPMLHLKSIHGCKQCYIDSIDRVTNKIIDERLLEDGRGFIRIGECVNSQTPITFRCKKKHEWTTKHNSVLGQYKTGCPKCYKSRNELMYYI